MSHIKKSWDVWKTIKIGNTSKKDMLKSLESNVSTYAEFIIQNMPIQSTEEEIQLVKIQVRELGLKEFPTTDELFARAKELGLELCPAEIGPHLYLNYTDQPVGEYVYVGMKQITDADGYPSVFRVYRGDDGSWLYDFIAEPSSAWDPGYEFVFRLRKYPFESLAPLCPSGTLTLGLLDS